MKYENCRGGFVHYHPPPKRAFIKSSSVGGRWDQIVLNKKANTGDPHTAEFVDMWTGWGLCMRTKDQMIGNVQNFVRGYSSRCLIDLPPPF